MSTSPEASTGDGFAMLSNRLITNGVLAHLRGSAVKVYQAILHGVRRERLTCWPGVKTLARWSGIPRNKIPEETAYLERHNLIVKKWIQIAGKPRRAYQVVQPDDPMFPDLRESCALCMSTDHRKSCVIRDPKTGRLLGRRRQPKIPDHRDAHSSDHRDRYMITDHRGTKQKEADEKIGSRRGGGVGGPGGDARLASPREAASLASPDPGGESAEKAKTASKGTAERRLAAIRTLVKTFSGDRSLVEVFARKSGYSEEEISRALESGGTLREHHGEDLLAILGEAGQRGQRGSQVSGTTPNPSPASPDPRAASEGNGRCAGLMRDRSE